MKTCAPRSAPAISPMPTRPPGASTDKALNSGMPAIRTWPSSWSIPRAAATWRVSIFGPDWLGHLVADDYAGYNALKPAQPPVLSGPSFPKGQGNRPGDPPAAPEASRSREPELLRSTSRLSRRVLPHSETTETPAAYPSRAPSARSPRFSANLPASAAPP